MGNDRRSLSLVGPLPKARNFGDQALEYVTSTTKEAATERFQKTHARLGFMSAKGTSKCREIYKPSIQRSIVLSGTQVNKNGDGRMRVGLNALNINNDEKTVKNGASFKDRDQRHDGLNCLNQNNGSAVHELSSGEKTISGNKSSALKHQDALTIPRPNIGTVVEANNVKSRLKHKNSNVSKIISLQDICKPCLNYVCDCHWNTARYLNDHPDYFFTVF